MEVTANSRDIGSEIGRISNEPRCTYTQSYIKNGEEEIGVTGVLMVVSPSSLESTDGDKGTPRATGPKTEK